MREDKTDSLKKFKRFVIKHTFIGCILAIIVFALGVYLSELVVQFNDAAGLIVIILSFVFLITAFIALYTACPYCYEFFAMKKTHSEILESHIEERRDRRHANHYDSQGRLIGRSSIPTSRTVNVEHVKVYYKCRNCGEITTRDKKRES